MPALSTTQAAVKAKLEAAVAAAHALSQEAGQVEQPRVVLTTSEAETLVNTLVQLVNIT